MVTILWIQTTILQRRRWLLFDKRKDTNVQIKLFQSREELEKEMIARYREYLKKAKNIDWRYTYFDSEKWYGSVDDWDDRVEYRCCEIAC